MDELNLMPQEYKNAEELKIKRIKYAAISVCIVLVIAAFSCIPLFISYDLSVSKTGVQDQIKKLSYVTDEINMLNKQKSVIEDRMKLLESVSADEITWSTVISEISSIMPADITADNLNCEQANISFHCETPSMQSIAVFMANLETSGIYEDIWTSEINYTAENKRYIFNISFKLKNVNGR